MKKALLILALLIVSIGTSGLNLNLAFGQNVSTMFIDPASIVNPDLGVGSNFTVTVKAANVTNLFTWQIKLFFNPLVLACTSAVVPTVNVFTGKTIIPVNAVIDNSSVLFGSSLLGIDFVNVDLGVLCTVDFNVIEVGVSNLTLDKDNSFFLDADLNTINTVFIDGLFDNRQAQVVHDIAVTSVQASPTQVDVGALVAVNVTVENVGTERETFNVTAFSDGTLIGTRTITLGPGSATTETFTWITSTVGNFTVSASAGPVPGETNLSNNTLTGNMVTVNALPPPPSVATMSVDPSSIVNSSLAPPSVFSLTVDVANASQLFTWQILLQFNASILQCTSASYPVDNVFAGKTMVPVTAVIDNVSGSVLFGASLIGSTTVDVQTGKLCQLDFQVAGVGTSELTLTGEESFLLNGDLNLINSTLMNGFFDNRRPIQQGIHDIAVTDVIPTPTNASAGESVSIAVTVANHGNFSEVFNVSALVNQTSIGTMEMTLNVSESSTTTFTWVTSVAGDFVIGATAGPVPNETNIADNTFFDGTVIVTQITPPPTGVHDIAVTNVVPTLTSVNVGGSVSIAVTVANLGNFSENFNVKAFANQTNVGTQAISLNVGQSLTLNITWVTSAPGSFVISATAGPVANETNVLNNTFVDGTVIVTQVAPPPTTGIFDVQWQSGQFDNGDYPVWKNFTVAYNGTQKLVYVSIRYPEVTPAFKPSRYEIRTFPEKQNWTISVNLVDRMIEFSAIEDGLTRGMTAIVSVEFVQGPTGEDCSVGQEFAVTVSEIDAQGQTFYLNEYIDKTPPNVEITFPDATTQGGTPYAFLKNSTGDIWVQMPNCTSADIRWLWINGTASDSCSGVNRVEIWINGTYKGDATLSKSQQIVRWSWSVDPTTDPSFWKSESWYYMVARAYDNSINDEALLPQGDPRAGLPLTNFADTAEHWLFWIGSTPTLVVQEQWVSGNQQPIHVNGTSGFYPNGNVTIWIENQHFNLKKVLTTVTADDFGRFYVIINLPLIPREMTVQDFLVVKAVDVKGNEGSDTIQIIPWITYETTDNSWVTSKLGHVNDTVKVFGYGFLPNTTVTVLYTDVSPLISYATRQVMVGPFGRFPNGPSLDTWVWQPRLSEVTLAMAVTNGDGYFEVFVTVPRSYGGVHAIYATDGVKSGWPEITNYSEEEAVLMDVLPTIQITPSTAITEQYVTITGEGLPLPRYYSLSKNDQPMATNRSLCLVLDFGQQYQQYVFENERIRNNELDLAWVQEDWYPFSFNSPDIALDTNSPVWSGTLTSATMDVIAMQLRFETGSKYLKVPVLAAGDYEVKMYYMDKATGAFTDDHDATTMLTVLKDPLNVAVDMGKIHLPSEIVSVFVQTDVDGMAADATALEIALYRGDTLVKTLQYDRINMGSYVATFTCPSEVSDYFVKVTASKSYEAFTLHGTALAGYTVNPTLVNINVRVIDMNDTVATLLTEIGRVKIDLAAINAKIVTVEGRITTVETNIGSFQTDLSTLNGKITSLTGRIATIDTDLGSVKTDVASLGGTITSVQGDMLTVHSDLGEIQVTLEDLNGFVELKNSVATIKTDLGEVKGRVLSLEGTTAEIETNLGTMTTKADSIKTNSAINPTNVGIALLTAIIAIAIVLLILKKGSTK